MPRNKLKRFSETKKMAAIIEHTDAGAKAAILKWINPDKKLVLELGCGSGEYALSLAEQNPQNQYIGIDIQGERLWYAGKTAEEKKLSNVLFLRTDITYLLDFFNKHSVDEIWLTFPDPQPKKRNEKKRLTAPFFLELYKTILKQEGIVHLKTDSKNLFIYTKEQLKLLKIKPLQKTTNIRRQKKDSALAITTYFENKKRAEGNNIRYLSWSFSQKTSPPSLFYKILRFFSRKHR